MENPLVSIIVPVYKVEDYIHRAVDSLICQTYTNLEIILVDDGSPDNCPKICDDYSQLDNRIKVIHKQNGGLSDARNVALDAMSGDYVTFVDSDDYVSMDYIEQLLNPIVEYNCQMSVIGMNIIDHDGKIYSQRKCDKFEIISGLDLTTRLIKDEYPYNFACGKIYEASLFNSIRYPLGRLYEDTATTYRISSKVKSAALIDKCGYYYFIDRPGNITSELNSQKAIRSYKDALINCQEQYEFCKKHIELGSIKNVLIQRMQLWSLLGLQVATSLDKSSYRLFMNFSLNILNLYPSLPMSFQLNFAFKFPTLYYYVYPIYKKIKKS